MSRSLATPDSTITIPVKAEHPITRTSTTGGCRHVEGLFSLTVWLEILAEIGFHQRVLPFDHSELELGSHEVFVARRPA